MPPAESINVIEKKGSKRLSNIPPPEIQQAFDSAVNSESYRVWKDEDGLTGTKGVMLPPGYKKFDHPEFPWICPIRSCRELFDKLFGLGKHFNITHRASRLNDNLDGTLSELGKYYSAEKGDGVVHGGYGKPPLLVSKKSISLADDPLIEPNLQQAKERVAKSQAQRHINSRRKSHLLPSDDEEDVLIPDSPPPPPPWGPEFDRRYFGLLLLFYEPTDDPPTPSTYRYKPLDTAKQEIRCAYLKPGKYEDDLVLSLRHVSYDDDELDYYALSYVWGSQQDPLPVYVEGCGEPCCWCDSEDVDPDNNIIMVTRNLDTALRHLRLRDLTMPIWVDAICIDQQNTTERSQQVAFMGEIYRKAGETYVWVGPEENYSNDAMDWIDLVGNCVEVDWSTEAMTSPEHLENSDIKAVADAAVPWDFVSPINLMLLCWFTDREYFKRLWTRQEVKLSPRKVLACGNKLLDWELFSGFARWMAAKPFVFGDNHTVWTPELADMYKFGSSLILNLCARTFDGAFPTLSRLRYDNSKLQWTDPRDAIYGSLGLLAPEYRQLGIEPDYDKDPAAVFTDVAVRVATKLHCLNFIESCVSISTELEGLPSWVPDWSSPLSMEAEVENIWSSCSWISAQVEYLGDGVMAANGVAISEVVEVDHWEAEALYDGQPYMVCDCIWRWCGRKPADYDELQEEYMEDSNLTWLEAWCILFLYGNIKDVFEAGQGSRINRPDLWSMQEAKELFLIILTAHSFHDIWSLDDEMWRRLEKFLSKIGDRMRGRTVFQTADGHIGVAPAVFNGDVVSVLLGCPVPVLLRPTQDGSRWRVSSTGFIVGLMDGEAIIGPLHHWRAVDWRYREGMSLNDKINRLHSGLFNDEDGTLKTDPSKVLEDCGIPCIRYEREPHMLEVSPDALRDAGINLQKFELV